MKSFKWRILLFDTKKNNPNHYLALYILNALKESELVEKAVLADYGNAISTAESISANLFFAFDGEQLDRTFCERLKSICGKSLVWNVEDPYELPINKRNSDLFDLVFTNDSGAVKEYGEKGRHLPLAASKKFNYLPVQEESNRYDLFFAGTAWPNRCQLLQKIEDNLEGIKLKLALPTNEHLPPINLKLPVSAYNWKMSNEQFGQFANRSSVTLSLHRKFTGSGGREEAQTPGPRLFEIAMAGSCQLIDDDIPGVRDYFKEGEDYIAYKTSEDCVGKLRELVESPEKRLRLAQSAQQKVLEFHTYTHRVEHILEEASKISSSDEESVEKEKKTLLFVSHNVLSGEQFGGVEVYVDSLTKNLSSDYQVLHFVPAKSDNSGKNYLLLDDSYKELKSFKFLTDLPSSCLFTLCNEEREKAFADLLHDYSIDIVHFQHLVNHVPSLPLIAKAMGVKTLFSMHDYYAVSHRYNLTDCHGAYQKNIFENSDLLDELIFSEEGIGRGSQLVRKSFWSRILNSFDVIHANSYTTKNTLLNHYPHLNQGKISVRGIPVKHDKKNCGEEHSTSSGLDIVILGNFNRIKGADQFLELFKKTERKNMRFHLYGHIDLHYEDAIKSQAWEHVKIYGSYKNEDLNSILEGKDLSIHYSSWPETYCMTLSEVWARGIVPIGSRLGALEERIDHGVNGFLVNYSSSSELLSTLNYIQNNPSILKTVKEKVNHELYETIPQHISWLTKIYAELSKGSHSYQNRVKESSSLCLKSIGIFLNESSWVLPPEFVDQPVVQLSFKYRVWRLAKLVKHTYRQQGLKVCIKKIKLRVKSKVKTALWRRA